MVCWWDIKLHEAAMHMAIIFSLHEHACLEIPINDSNHAINHLIARIHAAHLFINISLFIDLWHNEYRSN